MSALGRRRRPRGQHLPRRTWILLAVVGASALFLLWLLFRAL
jgi:hypothetical protein